MAMCGTMALWIRSSCLLILAASIAEQQECSVANLPRFHDDILPDLRRSPDDRLQAIVPAYSFDCTGIVTEWMACMDPGYRNDRYYIQFQVWRPTGVPGCYRLVGYNAPPEPSFDEGELENAEKLLQPGGFFDDCVQLPVSEDEQIEFQPGDVIGYYVDRFESDGDNPSSGGVQLHDPLIGNSEVVVYQRNYILLSSMTTEDVFVALGVAPSLCGIGAFEMLSTNNVVPVISLSLSTAVITAIPALAQTSAMTSTPSLSVLLPTPPIPASLLTATPSVPNGHSSSSSAATLSFSPTRNCRGCSKGCDGFTNPPLSNNSLSIVVGVAGALLILITATVIIITVLVCLKKGNKGPDLVDNVAYNSSIRDIHARVRYSSGDAHILTSTNVAYGTAKVNNEAHVATDIPTSTNPAYEQTQCQGGQESYIYDYPRADSKNF